MTTPKQTAKTPEIENQPNIYACFNPSALSLLAPHLLANQTAAAAALMMANPSWPIQLRAQLASSIGLPSPSPFFPPGWPMTPPLSHKSATNSPPPTSPLSPVQHSKKMAKITNNNYTNMNNNHIVVSTTTDLMIKKKRKVDDKNDHTVPGSISPPTSSSSPQSSNNSGEFASSSSRDPTKDKVFTCKICNRSFGYKHVLQNHERTHTGEVNFF